MSKAELTPTAIGVGRSIPSNKFWATIRIEMRSLASQGQPAEFILQLDESETTVIEKVGSDAFSMLNTRESFQGRSGV